MNKIKIGLSIILLMMSISIVSADTQIRRPTSDYINNWSVYPSGTHWAAIDETISNSDTDYVYSSTIDKKVSVAIDPFNIPNNSVINKVTAYITGKRGSGGGNQIVNFYFLNNSKAAVNFTNSQQFTTSYINYSYNISTCTKTPYHVFTVNELNNISGVCTLRYIELYNSLGGSEKRVTQVYIEVNYTPPQPTGYIPPTPTLNTVLTGNFWANTSWTAGTGNITNSYNYSVNGGAWTNGTTNLYHNSTLSAHAWHNITVYAYNNSGDGNLSVSPLIVNTQIPNNVPVQQAIGDQIIGVGKWLNFSIISTDADSDSLTYGTNATLGTLTGNNFSFKPTINDVGIYYWSYNTSDGYGGIATETIKVTVKRNTVTHLALVG